ncbi:hypothetical protein [Psychrobacillus sp.]|uniref:hypothetical protein n=1 Tax=Psychrobacillus sp. TaxID=1871623 RepID=UPI0028BE2117|nr:hypothetical protein [Psychrobacillus sp.]
MRNAILLPNDLVLTTDNSAGIGGKAADVVRVDDEIVSYFAARVALLEQWAARATPLSIVVHNFSGNKSWDNYVAGIEHLFATIGEPCPAITGSTESNIEMLQSAVAVTMIGEKVFGSSEEFVWYVYGVPCVGDEVLNESEKVADLKKIWDGLTNGLVVQVWPVGSTGILAECKRLGLQGEVEGWDVLKSAGPATSTLLGIVTDRIDEAVLHFGRYLEKINC